ncbi:MAG: hypothetical protein IIY21_06100 [Clostridiales bacterium]|nr:hypothetical protein [Clostridiales bacterium]
MTTYILHHPNGTVYRTAKSRTEALKLALALIYKYYPIEGERKKAYYLNIYKDKVAKSNLYCEVFMNFGKRGNNKLSDYPVEHQDYFKVRFQDHVIFGEHALYKLNKNGTLGKSWLVDNYYPPSAIECDFGKQGF